MKAQIKKQKNKLKKKRNKKAMSVHHMILLRREGLYDLMTPERPIHSIIW